jgi:hypothetical protein
VEKVASLDETLVYMVRDLRATVPLARLLTTGFPADLDKRATEVTLVEESTLFDVPTAHLAVRTPDVDLQLWIARGPEPLPRRVIITYKNGRSRRNLTPGHSRSCLRPVPSRSRTSRRGHRRMKRPRLQENRDEP